MSRRGDANGTTGDCLGLTVLSFMVSSCVTNNWWSQAESWSCFGGGEQRATLMYWVRQESEIGNTM